MPFVDAQCRTCGGTGLRSHEFLPDFEAAICETCAGTGCEQIGYKPFAGRQGRLDVALVHSPDFHDTISYAEFEAGAYPGERKTEAQNES